MSVKTVKMTAMEILLPENGGYEHVATSWQICKDIEFKTGSSMVLESLNDTKNKLSLTATIDVDDNTPLYGRHMMHITKNGVAQNNTWSRITPFNSNMKGMKINNFMVGTPKVTVETEEDKIKASTSKFNMFSGAGTHASTSWSIKSSYGEDRYIRKNDRDNLLNIDVRGVVETGKAYVVEAKHTNNFNNESFSGRDILLNYSADLELFGVEFPEEFIADRKFYFRLKVYTPLFVSYDFEIRDRLTNQVVKSKYNATSLVDYILLDGLTVFNTYDIYGRFRFEDGKVTQYSLVYSGILLQNRVTPYRPYVEYLDKLEAYNDIGTDGIACVSTRETYDGTILLPAFNGDRIDAYKVYANKLMKTKMVRITEIANFTYALNIDYCNILQMPNHDILIDYNVYDEIGHKHTAFIQYEYNPIKLTMTPLKTLIRDNEQYSTSLCNSIGVLKDNTIIYVPAFYSETKDATRSVLPMFTVNPNTFTLSDPIELPFEAKYNVSLVVDQDDNVFLFGGSEDIKYDSKDNNVECWKRDNNEVWKYDVKTKSFTKVADIPAEYSTDIYCLQGFLRLDGKIVLFNGSHSGPGMKIQEELVFDPSDYSFAILKTDMDWDIPFRSNIVNRNGCITRVSAKVLDPQKSYTYISNVKDEDSIVKIEGSDNDVTDLIVPSGKTVNVEDLYKFDTISIRGTGILRWFRPQGILELTSSDLIVTRDTKMAQDAFNEGRWQNVLVLEGTNFTVVNDTKVTATILEVKPTELTIKVGEKAGLTVNTNDTEATVSIDNQNIASIDVDTNEVSGLAVGSTVIRFHAQLPGSVPIDIVVTVNVVA